MSTFTTSLAKSGIAKLCTNDARHSEVFNLAPFEQLHFRHWTHLFSDEGCQVLFERIELPLARLAVMRIPPKRGVPVAFRNGAWVGSGASAKGARRKRDALIECGLITQTKGYFDHTTGNGKVTRLHPTDKLRALLRDRGVTSAMLNPPPQTVTFLNEPTTTEAMPEWAKAEEVVIRAYNEHMRGVAVSVPDDIIDRLAAEMAERPDDDPLALGGFDEARVYLSRIFKGSWERGGRLYGPFWQNMPKAYRSHILIDGEPIVELDFQSLHPNMLYSEQGEALDSDPYLIEGQPYDRQVGKVLFQRLLNNQGKEKGKFLRFDDISQEDFPSKAAYLSFQKAMIDKHEAIAHNFRSDQGMRLQMQDSRLTIDIIRRCLGDGITCLPIHDSFIVKEAHQERLRDIMIDAYKARFGTSINIHCNDCTDTI